MTGAKPDHPRRASPDEPRRGRSVGRGSPVRDAEAVRRSMTFWEIWVRVSISAGGRRSMRCRRTARAGVPQQ